MNETTHLTQEDIVYLGALLQQTKSKNVINAYAKILIEARKSGQKDKPEKILHNEEIKVTTTMSSFTMAGSSLLTEGFISLENLPQEQRDFFVLDKEQKNAAIFGMVAIKEGMFTQQQINQILSKWSHEYENTKCSIAQYTLQNRFIETAQLQALLSKTGQVNDGLGQVSFRNKILQVSGSVPNSFGRYQIEKEIARGGMGIVYKAYDPSFERHVALKILINKENSSQIDVARFKREAQSLYKIKHDNIVPIYDLGQEKGIPYFCMAFIDGHGLDKEPTPMNYRKAAKMLIPIADSLHSAHQQGIIHRDIKPANIMIDKEGKSWLTDFGLAKDAEGIQELTRAGSFMGTPAYMPPEQIDHPEAVDQKCDIYSLGIVFYILLIGKPPYEANTFPSLLRKISEGNAKPPHVVSENIPEEASKICMRAIAKKKKDRYSSAQRFAKDLESLLHSPRSSRTMSLKNSKIKSKKKKKKENYTYIIVLGIATTFLLILFIFTGSSNDERERVERERVERENLEREKLEREKLERENLEREKLERENLEREKLERENLEREKLEREKLEREKLEREKLEREKLDNTNPIKITLYEANNKVNKAREFIRIRNYSAADREVEMVLTQFPDHAGALYEKSVVLLAYRQFEDALKFIDKAIDIDSSIAPFHSHRGQIFGELKKFAEAETNYTKAISLQKCTHCYFERAKIYLYNLDLFEKAIEDFKYLVDIEKYNEGFYQSLGYAFMKAGNPDNAVQYFSDFIQKNPQISFPYVQRGMTYFEILKNNEKAEADFKKAIELDSNYYDAYEKIAYLHITQSKFDVAIENLNKAIQINGKNFMAYMMRGDCYERQQKRSEAIKDWKKSLALLQPVKLYPLSLKDKYLNTLKRKIGG